jgi:hypothetical protein
LTKIEAFKRDWKQFTELRRSVQVRDQEIVDIKEFEPKVQKLLDDHVIVLPAETIIKPIDINDRATSTPLSRNRRDHRVQGRPHRQRPPGARSRIFFLEFDRHCSASYIT